MGGIVEGEREDVFGSLFDDGNSSDGDDAHDNDPALVELVHVRTKAAGRASPVPPTLRLSLVSSRHSLWGHRLWNAALLLAEMFETSDIDVEGKTVLELGAGAGLPGLVCALKGARKVVISDYSTSTDQTLMVPIQMNIERIQPEFVPRETLYAVGHVWGHPVEDLLEPLTVPAPSVCQSTGNRPPVKQSNDGGGRKAAVDENVSRGPGEGFDVVIMADLLFNRSQHAQLLDSCDRCLGRSKEATAWVSFSHHDPEKAELDMNFFAVARQKGFIATKPRRFRCETCSRRTTGWMTYEAKCTCGT